MFSVHRFRSGLVLCAIVLVAAVCQTAGATTIRGTVKLPDDLRRAGQPANHWPRQENGMVRIAPPLRSPLADVVVVIEGAAAPQNQPVQLSVDLEGAEFSPRVVPIAVGTTIEYRNRDKQSYSLYSPGHTSFFTLEETAPGATRQIRFLAPGIYGVRTAEFPHMESSVLVLGPAAYVRPDDQGAFRIENVAEGQYNLRVFFRDAFVHEQPIQVSGKAMDVALRIVPVGPGR